MTTPEALAKDVVAMKVKKIGGQSFACFGLKEEIARVIREAVSDERQACTLACAQVRAASCGSVIAAAAANECVKAICARKD